MAPPMLAVSGVTAGYGALPVLRGVAFSIEAGEIVAVLGGNGAGKSTLNNTLSGLPEAERRAHPVRRRRHRRRARPRRSWGSG